MRPEVPAGMMFIASATNEASLASTVFTSTDNCPLVDGVEAVAPSISMYSNLEESNTTAVSNL
jgi:hypothetical protein